MSAPPRHALATEIAPCAGELVAIVEAETRNAALDSAEAVNVDAEVLPAVTSVERAAAAGALAPRMRDRIEVRRRNLLSRDQIPFRIVAGQVCDSGDFPGTPDAAPAQADWHELAVRRAEARALGGLPGRGLGFFVGITSLEGIEGDRHRQGYRRAGPGSIRHAGGRAGIKDGLHAAGAGNLIGRSRRPCHATAVQSLGNCPVRTGRVDQCTAHRDIAILPPEWLPGVRVRDRPGNGRNLHRRLYGSRRRWPCHRPGNHGMPVLGSGRAERGRGAPQGSGVPPSTGQLVSGSLRLRSAPDPRLGRRRRPAGVPRSAHRHAVAAGEHLADSPSVE